MRGSGRGEVMAEIILIDKGGDLLFVYRNGGAT